MITNNTSGINTEIKVNGQNLETVTRFKYLGSVITDEGSKPEILSRIAQATAALTRLKPVWINKSISLSSKIRLMRSLVTSIFLYSTWIMDPHSRAPKKNTSHWNEVLPQDTTHLIQRPCYQRGSPCQDPAGNWTTWGSPDDHKEMQIAVVWSRFPVIRSDQNHLARHSERGRRQGRQRKRWEGNIRKWAGLEFGKSQRAVENRGKWRKLVAKSSVMPQRPLQLRDWWWWWWWGVGACKCWCCLLTIVLDLADSTSEQFNVSNALFCFVHICIIYFFV